MAYTEWGDAENPDVLVCVHGLTRNGRDFDHAAEVFAKRYRVVCPDVVGRGRSDRVDAALYEFPQYVADLVTLIARLDVPRVRWLGTSMGGLIGMVLAAMPRSPIAKLALNDVAPVAKVEALRRIASYVGKAPTFATEDDAERYLRGITPPSPGMSDAQWRAFSKHLTRRRDDGAYELNYDPGIARPAATADLVLWPYYDAVRCPTFLLRGGVSDLVSADTARELETRGPRARHVDVPGAGHTPMLLDDAAELAPLQRFFEED